MWSQCRLTESKAPYTLAQVERLLCLGCLRSTAIFEQRFKSHEGAPHSMARPTQPSLSLCTAVRCCKVSSHKYRVWQAFLAPCSPPKTYR